MKITLCGSTRFKDAFIEHARTLTLAGHVVYTVSSFWHDEKSDLTDDDKIILDCVHFQKIDESDAILVLNVDGYVGESTAREIVYAAMNGKNIMAIEPGGRVAALVNRIANNFTFLEVIVDKDQPIN